MSEHGAGTAKPGAARPKSPPWDHELRRPKLELPPGACDTHFHFLGPQNQFPMKQHHTFSHLEFDDDTIDDWLKMQEVLGLSRGLHVLSMMYEHNYEIMLHSLCRLPDRLRGVISPWSGITDRELEILTQAGVVGYRICHRVEPVIDDRLVARVHEHGWGIHYLFRGQAEIDRWRRQILASPGNFVIEHMGVPPPGQGIDSPEFRFVRECLDTGRCWVKLSPRFSDQQDFPFADTTPFIHKVVADHPTRLLWGSDWPHPQYFKPMPNDADLVDMMLDWVPDEKTRKLIFVDNPAELFGFPPVGA
jgi:predicted TIM-barrel fold metal-dependent hydrolase